MAVIFVTGSDTGVGKTRVAAWLARHLAKRGATQVVKPVESGVAAGRPADAPQAAGSWAKAHTLMTLPAALAPVTAAKLAKQKLRFKQLVKLYQQLPRAKHRVVEGAGGVSVPIDERGHDWADFIQEIKPDWVVMVVPDCLGAINQARLTLSYLRRVYRGKAGVWLNAAQGRPSAAVARSNREALKQLGIPVIGQSGFRARRPAPIKFIK